jgi:hypothetical protein
MPTTNPLNLAPEPKLPYVREILVEMFYRTIAPDVIAVFWRPAAYFYLYLAAVILAAVRLREGRFLVIGVPATAAYALYIVLPPSPELRYFYSVYLSSVVLTLPLLCVRGKPVANSVRITTAGSRTQTHQEQT